MTFMSMAKTRLPNRELQHQRHQLAAARADALARGVRARRRRPAGTQMHRRGLPARGDRGAWLCGDLARAAELERRRDPEPGRRAGRDSPRRFPTTPTSSQSRYIEAAVCGILIGNMYAPNGNPKPGPKFDYKLAWLDRLHEHAQALLDSGRAGDADRRLQRHSDRRGRLQARTLGQGRAVRARSAREVSRAGRRRAGPTRSASFIPTSASTPSGIIGGTRSSATPASASTTRCSARPGEKLKRRRRPHPEGGRRPATTRRCGSTEGRAKRRAQRASFGEKPTGRRRKPT